MIISDALKNALENGKLEFEFSHSDNFIDNFKEIINIMNKNGIEKINVIRWDNDAKAHFIEGYIHELEPFMKSK